jgi:hypothetical protein
MPSHSHTDKPKIDPNNLRDDKARFQFLWSDPRPLVIMLLLMRRQIMTAKEIATYLDSHPETITQKLRVLSSLDLVSRPQVKGGWMLTADGWRFMLHSADNPRFDFASTSLSQLDIGIKAVVVSNNADLSRKKPGKRGKSALSESQQELVATVNADILAELRVWGININAHTAEIAHRDYITPEYICAHGLRLRKAGKLNPGLLIQILDDHDTLLREDTIHHNRYQDILQDRLNYKRSY